MTSAFSEVDMKKNNFIIHFIFKKNVILLFGWVGEIVYFIFRLFRGIVLYFKIIWRSKISLKKYCLKKSEILIV